MKKTILILGGSSSIAKELAKLHEIDEIYYSYHSTVDNTDNAFYLDVCNLNSYQNIPIKQYDIIYSFLGNTPDINLIEDLETSKATIEKNFLYPTLILQFILKNKLVSENCKIKVITSVAGIRGRGLNYVYGASKSGVSTLIEGLANKYNFIKFNNIVLGPVYTKAVPKHKTPAFLISRPTYVALKIYKAKFQKTYVPFRWFIIISLIRLLPNCLYNRTNF